jgi:hypothetical protein
MNRANMHKLIEAVERLLPAVADRGFLCAAFKFPRNPIPARAGLFGRVGANVSISSAGREN